MEPQKLHDTFVRRLISLVTEISSLWYEYDEARYWDEIVFRLKRQFKSEKITVESCKEVWKRLGQAHWESNLHPTATTFTYHDYMVFSWTPEKLFYLQNSVYFSQDADEKAPIKQDQPILKIRNVVMAVSIGIFFIMNLFGCFYYKSLKQQDVGMIELSWMFGLLFPFYVVLLMKRLTTSLDSPKTMLFLMFLHFVISMTVVSVACVPSTIIDVPWFGWQYLEMMSRPYQLIEYALHLLPLFGNAIVSLLLVPIFDWNMYYFFFPAVLFTNLLILVIYDADARLKKEEYPMKGIVHYTTEPETEENPFSLVIRKKAENKKTMILEDDSGIF